MSDPYTVLGLPPEADDESIRRRYLELVRKFTPEHQPEKFVAIRAAYESLKDLETRLHYRLFEAGKNETLEAIIEDIQCRRDRSRIPLEKLLTTLKKP